ncbi:MAG TPA: N-acetylmuramoyl-L-alanine amidase [Actinomycetota bacterium]|nr:N-acetylmuramoyl-L-alanine amidase [Actinomycetota bacterium]
MTHEPAVDADSLADAPEIEAPADALTEPLEGIPIGEVKEETFDYDPMAELEKAVRGSDEDSLADVALDVVVQMGHVARTTGKTGTEGEQDFARAAAGHTAARLAKDGRVVRVIGADEAVPRSEVFVAIHCDGHSNRSAHGASVGFRDNNGKRVAHAWKEAYQRGGWSRGFRQDNLTVGLSDYYGTKKATQAGTPFAFILEAGFLTNVEDRRLLATETGHLRCAEAIRQSVSAVLGATGQEPVPGDDQEVEMFTFGVQSSNPTEAGMWLLAGDGKAHHIPKPSDVQALNRAGVKDAGELSREFLLRFERVHPDVGPLP